MFQPANKRGIKKVLVPVPLLEKIKELCYPIPVTKVLNAALTKFFSDPAALETLASHYKTLDPAMIKDTEFRQFPLSGVIDFSLYEKKAIMLAFYNYAKTQHFINIIGIIRHLKNTPRETSRYRCITFRWDHFIRVRNIADCWVPDFRPTRVIDRAIADFFTKPVKLDLEYILKGPPPEDALDTWKYINIEHLTYLTLVKNIREFRVPVSKAADLIMFYLRDSDFERAIENLAIERGDTAQRFLDKDGKVTSKIILA